MFQLCNSIKDLSKIDTKNYIFEIKIDGTRVMAYLKGGKIVKLINRRNFDILDKFPELKSIKIPLKKDVAFDCELCILKPNSFKCDFSALLSREHNQNELRKSLLMREYPATLMIFDVLVSNGLDTTKLKLIERKEILKSYYIYLNKNVQIIPYFFDLPLALKVMEYNESEGLILKKIGSIYENRRSENWLKFKKRAELVMYANKYENNKDNSITLTDGFHRVKVNHNIDFITAEIDKGHKITAEIEGLEITKNGHLRMSQFKRIIWGVKYETVKRNWKGNSG